MRRFVAGLVVGTLISCGGLALAETGGSARKVQALKLGQAPHVANLRGQHYYFGPAVLAEPAGSRGVSTLAYSIAKCPKHRHAIAGGWNSNDTTNDPISITSNLPSRGADGWIVIAKDQSTKDNGDGYVFQAVVSCD